MQTPFLLVNFKTYDQASGKQALQLAYTCEKVAHQTGANVAIAVQNADIARIAPKVDIPVLAQHVDPDSYGSNTGSDIVETLAYNGASGTLINHSEDQSPLDNIKGSIERCHDKGLTSIVCVDNPRLAESVAGAEPDFIAYEPPELIGGNVSVASSKPDILKQVVQQVSGDVAVLAGAGIKRQEDVSTSLELGAEGVLIASGVVKADDREKTLTHLLEPLR